MTMDDVTQRFVNYFGELGPRWGLPTDACRVHAYLYLRARPTCEQSIADALALDATQLTDAFTFLVDFQMIKPVQPSGWQASEDPWEMLATGLEERRRRELPPALATLRDCHRDAFNAAGVNPITSAQIEKMLALVENLASLDRQMQRLSPQLLRGLVNVSAKAAKFVDRTFGLPKGGKA